MKTSFSKIAIIVTGLMTAAAAQAEYIYAMLGDAEGKVLDEYTGKAVEFTYATFSVPADSGYSRVAVGGVPNGSVSSGTTTSFYIGDDTTTFNTFLVELWLTSLEEKQLVGYKEYDRSAFVDSIYYNPSGTGSGTSGTGSGTPFAITGVIPEPSSALLLLFGLAGLAIRRRKVVVSMLAVAFVGATFAAQNDLLVSFSTKGPDTYADGSTVIDGECYALVWTPNNVASATIAADGTAEDGAQIVLVAPIAKNGRCPKVVYRVDAKRVETEFAKGKGNWSVYLLDTRKYSYDDDGNQVVTLAGVKPDGNVKLVNASTRVSDATLKAGTGENVSLASNVASKADIGSALPADVPQPTIVGIEVKGGNVYVTVENAASYLAYDLETGDTPDAVNESVNNPRTGEDDGTVVLVAPAKEGGAFFRVNRK